MKTKITQLLILLTLFYSQISVSQTTDTSITPRLILKFKTNKTPNSKTVIKNQNFDNSEIILLNKKHSIKSIKLTGNKNESDTYILNFNELNTPIESLIKSYLETGLFEYVEPDYIGYGHGVQTTPDDTSFYRQWQHYNDGTFTTSATTIIAKEDADMDTDLAWDITQGDPDLIIAVLDSGAKLDHPELSGRIWSNSKESSDANDSDSNGYIDDINGWDFVNDDNDPTDDHGHGTNVTGIIAANGNNTTGFAGVNWNSKIMICKVLNASNSGYYSNWAEAIYYAVDNGASVINLSAGGASASVLLEDAITYAYENNVTVVVSAGNQNSSTLRYPAKYDKAFAIGATNSDDTRSAPFSWGGGSNYGPELDFVAPGNFIFGLNYLDDTKFGTYWSGTSQAAPQVTGVISLILSVNPDLTVDEIHTILEASSEDEVGDPTEDTSGYDEYYGFGRINAYQALTNEAISGEALSINAIVTNESNLLIYPNPISNTETLKISNIVNGEYYLEIYNTLGQSLNRIQTTTENTELPVNISELSSGTYFVKVRNKLQNNSIIKKFIVK
ncbi:S8/S53 family peptidase [uncultured Formosa sp.]|uniref:S8/S53 family peptidase n=1 Tax=uncultured Formosa sp. TaxID=255435 RepID=UPI00261E4D00|nr:S8/S53 family peptidase [uncultured Formosa sp.]